MQKKFIQSLSLLLLLNLLIKPFWLFGIDREVQNITGTEVYGLYYALLNFSFLLNVILDPGLTAFNNRNIAQNRQLLTKHFSALIPVKLILSGVYFTVTIGIAYLLGYREFSIYLLLFLGFNQILASMILYFRSNLAGLHLFTTDSILSVLDRLLMILFCGVLLMGIFTKAEFRIEWFVYAQSLSYLVTAILAFFMVLKKAEFLKLKFDPGFILIFLKQSYPFALLMILMAMYQRIDSVMLERLLENGSYHTGIYAAAYRILDALVMFAFLFGTLLFPIFSRMLKLKEKIDTIVKLSMRLLLIPGIIICIACYGYRFEIMELLYVDDFSIKGKVFGYLIFTLLAMSLVYIFGTLLTANNNLKILNRVSLSCLTLNIILNLILIPKYQVFGAVIATLSTQFLAGIIQSIIALRKFKISFSLHSVVKTFLFLILLPVIIHFTFILFDQWFYGFIFFIILCVIFAVILKLINPGHLWFIIKNRTT